MTNDRARPALLERLRQAGPDAWDLIIVGGGATGLGTAVDAATRGYRTLLLEAGDFASGTSGKATKLVHGGVRYLAQGRISMVREALRERDVLLRNAPHVAWPLGFVIPAYRMTDRLFYGIGLKAYDALAGGRGIGRSRILSAAETAAALPNVNRAGLRGGVLYFDGQFDDAGLALALARTAALNGAVLLNYVGVDGFLREGGADGRIVGVTATDAETGEPFALRARCVVNATGVWVDSLRRLDRADSPAMLAPSQGTHLVLPRDFLPGERALLVPRTDDGRVLFVVPWLHRTVVGTTDIALTNAAGVAPGAMPPAAAVPMAEEIEYLLQTVAPYLTRQPARSDILSTWAGLRPLVHGDAGAAGGTARLSREHVATVSATGLLTVTGGKWTTYRAMAEEVIDLAIAHGLLEPRSCRTVDLPLERAGIVPGEADEPLGPVFDLTGSMVRNAVRTGYALTVEDVLARRHRALLLDARAAIDLAPAVAALIGDERGMSRDWIDGQVAAFRAEALRYLPA